MVKFEFKDKDRKKVSVYPAELECTLATGDRNWELGGRGITLRPLLVKLKQAGYTEDRNDEIDVV